MVRSLQDDGAPEVQVPLSPRQRSSGHVVTNNLGMFRRIRNQKLCREANRSIHREKRGNNVAPVLVSIFKAYMVRVVVDLVPGC